MSLFYWFRQTYWNIVRVVQFIPIVWQHRDWDYAFIYTFNAFLYKRLYAGVITNGHGIHSKAYERRLKAIIALYERLANEDENPDLAEAAFEKKWGKSKYEFRPIKTESDLKFTTMVNLLEESLTPDQLKQYKKERKAIWSHQAYILKQNKEYLYKLLLKYNDRYWD